MCAGTREDGSVIEPNDPFWDALQMAALRARDTPSAWLAQRDTYGDLADQPEFAAAFAKWLSALWREGCRATLQNYLRT